jgi:hypothetical protein
MFNKKEKTPCEHYWVKDLREYTRTSTYGSRTIGKDQYPMWRCNKCKVWEDELEKNKIN